MTPAPGSAPYQVQARFLQGTGETVWTRLTVSLVRGRDGELLAVVEVPGVAQTSSCAFAGPGRDLLVVSTSAEGLDDAARAAQPDAGRLFTARPGVTGPPARPYRGPLEGLRQAT